MSACSLSSHGVTIDPQVWQDSNADTTKRVLVEHLICACTGLPRQDMEWLFQFDGVTPEGAMATLANFQQTSKFGEMFQYSNLLAGAAGFIGGQGRTS